MPRCIHRVQRCGLLLPMFRLCLLVTTLSPRTAEPVEMSLRVWTRVCQGTMYWVGARIPAGEGAIFGASPGSLWSIGTLYHELCKNRWTNQHAVWDETSGGLKEPWITRGSKFPLQKGALLDGDCAIENHCTYYFDQLIRQLFHWMCLHNTLVNINFFVATLGTSIISAEQQPVIYTTYTTQVCFTLISGCRLSNVM